MGALAFIVELDELIYHTAVPEDVMCMVDSYKVAREPDEQPEQGDGEAKKCRLFVRRMGTLIGTIAFVTIFPYVYMHYLQQVLPGYKWDVHEHCEHHVADKLNGRRSSP